MPENAVGFHVLVNVKALNIECRDPVFFVFYYKRAQKNSAQGIMETKWADQ